MSDSKMREQFEAWFLSVDPIHYMDRFASGEYRSTTVRYCWLAWHAARLVPADGGPLTNEGTITQAIDMVADVRAVDELVAYISDDGKHLIFADKASGNAGCPLYRHANRQMVMPERELYTKYLRGMVPSNAKEVSDWRDGWNACIDEVKRLNP